jgi:hypothetical protein
VPQIRDQPLPSQFDYGIVPIGCVTHDAMVSRPAASLVRAPVRSMPDEFVERYWGFGSEANEYISDSDQFY